MQAYAKVLVNGFDVTTALAQYLLKIHVTDTGRSECTLELDDRDGRLDIPPVNANLVVQLGWQSQSLIQVFTGFIQEIEHSFDRANGRRMHVIGTAGTTFADKAKSPFSAHMGTGAPPGQTTGATNSVSAFLQQAAGFASTSIDIHPYFNSIMRDYFAQTNESFLHLGQRLAEEHGGVFGFNSNNGKWQLTQAGQDPNGSPTGTINALWGDNLINWKIHPFSARSSWQGSSQLFYDPGAAQWKKIASQFGLSMPWSIATAVFNMRNPAPSSQVATQQTQGASGTGEQYIGGGTILIDGEPSARWQMSVVLTGARPGVDGTYRIGKAEHDYERGGGYTTTLTVFPTTQATGITGGVPVVTNQIGSVWTSSNVDVNGNIVITNASGGTTTIDAKTGNTISTP